MALRLTWCRSHTPIFPPYYRVLIADAGHSLSDLISDFITLWSVQIARLPPDEDHRKFHVLLY